MHTYKSLAQQYSDAACILMRSNVSLNISAHLLSKALHMLLLHTAQQKHIVADPDASLESLWYKLYPHSFSQHKEVLQKFDQYTADVNYESETSQELTPIQIKQIHQEYVKICEYILKDIDSSVHENPNEFLIVLGSPNDHNVTESWIEPKVSDNSLVADSNSEEPQSLLFGYTDFFAEYFTLTAPEFSEQLHEAYAKFNRHLIAGENILFVGDSPRDILSAMKYTLMANGVDYRFICDIRSKFMEFPQAIELDARRFPHTFPALVRCLTQIENREQAYLATLAAVGESGFISTMQLRDPEAGEDSFQLYAQKCAKLNLSADIFNLVILVKVEGQNTTLRILKAD